RDQEDVDVIDEEVLEPPQVAVEEEGAGGGEAGDAVNAAVGGGDDDGRQFAARDGAVERLDDVLDEALLVLAEAVQVDRQRVALARVVAGRHVDVQVALFAQGVGPDAAGAALGGRVGDGLAGERAG